MGLDNFWKKIGLDPTTEESTGNLEGDFKVWAGGCSDHGNTSFRGKVYYTIVEEITGVSLYDDVIEHEKCKEMLECLEDFDFSQICQNPYDLTQEDYDLFVYMFKKHIEAGHYLVSWW
jgi:hypothetical protein